MLKKILHICKRAVQMLAVVVLGFAISLSIRISVDESLRFPTHKEMHSLDNISKHVKYKERTTIQKSRESILYVLSENENGTGFAKMSGTYVTYNDRFYVITAAHGIMSDCDGMLVASDSEHLYDCIRYVLVDRWIDYAIIEIEKVNQRIPVKLNDVIPSNREWRQEISILNDVFYTGYPNGLGPLTFRGSVAGLSDDNYIYLHSYAWPGSSGSGVFSYDGNMIGIIIALNVGLTGAGYDVLEDLVIVTPLYMIDWDTAYDIMDEPPPASDTGDTAE